MLDKSAPLLLLRIKSVQEHIAWVCHFFLSMLQNNLSELFPDIVLEVAAKTQYAAICKLSFALAIGQVAEAVVDDTNFSGRFNHALLFSEHPF